MMGIYEVTLIQIVPHIAAAGTIITTFVIAMRSNITMPKNTWIFPALLCGFFSAWTLLAVISEGPLGFWTEHSRNLWGNQIWFDLLLAIGITWGLSVPRAKMLNMPVLLWLIFVIGTGSIGLLAMLARVLYLETKVV